MAQNQATTQEGDKVHLEAVWWLKYLKIRVKTSEVLSNPE